MDEAGGAHFAALRESVNEELQGARGRLPGSASRGAPASLAEEFVRLLVERGTAHTIPPAAACDRPAASSGPEGSGGPAASGKPAASGTKRRADA